jgi:uncharacterized membrane protein
MTNEQAARIVVISGAGMATFVLIQAKRQGKPTETTFRSLWAIGLLTLGLAVFADFAPQVAGPFALLVLIAMAVRNTGTLGSVIGGGGTPAKKKPYRSTGTRKSETGSQSPGIPHQ